MIILYVLLGLIALLLLVGLVSKRSYTIVRETTVSAASQTVFDYIRHLRNQDHYSKWNMTDPAKRTTFTGEDGAVGFIYAWDGNKQAGAGEQEIMGIKPGESIETE